MKTFIINLAERHDRKIHAIEQFNNKKEFVIKFINLVKKKSGALGLWFTIKHIIETEVDEDDEFFILCQDIHTFTDNYSRDVFMECINHGRKLGADIILGGLSGFRTCIPVLPYLYWIESFSGLQFTVVFKKFFSKILNTDVKDFDNAESKISELTSNKFVIFPFVSVKSEFGYSQVTIRDKDEQVLQLFSESTNSIKVLSNVYSFYERMRLKQPDLSNTLDDMAISTYVINLPERTDRKQHIEEQFKNRSEFDLTIIPAIRHKIGAVGLWESIKSAVSNAKSNAEDAILICEDDHEFTPNYNRASFLSNILDAHHRGTDLLIGGIGGGVDHILPVTRNLFWVNSFWSTQFIVIYRDFFDAILNEPFGKNDTADSTLSIMTSKKLVIYPFISIQREFQYSDVTSTNNNPGTITRLFTSADKRFYNVYNNIYK